MFLRESSALRRQCRHWDVRTDGNKHQQQWPAHPLRFNDELLGQHGRSLNREMYVLLLCWICLTVGDGQEGTAVLDAVVYVVVDVIVSICGRAAHAVDDGIATTTHD